MAFLTKLSECQKLINARRFLGSVTITHSAIAHHDVKIFFTFIVIPKLPRQKATAVSPSTHPPTLTAATVFHEMLPIYSPIDEITMTQKSNMGTATRENILNNICF
jgi:hypothetical protein